MVSKSSNVNITKSESEWRQQLTDEQYRITRKRGTEKAFSGPYWDEKASGLYYCICCNKALFSSKSKYNSGTGWPSFYQPISENVINEFDDRKLFMHRTEVRCANCDSHLGHVFPDGPEPTGLRYCINGHALQFQPNQIQESE